MKNLVYGALVLTMVFGSMRITHAIETSKTSVTTRGESAFEQVVYSNEKKIEVDQPIFEKQKWDEGRLNLLREVLKQESISTSQGVLPKTRVSDFSQEVKQFQKKYNLPQTGTIGPLTTKTLNTVVARRLEDHNTQAVPIEKIDFYQILVELPCLNGKKLVTDCTSTQVTPDELYERRNAISTWLTTFEKKYRELNYRNLTTQVNFIKARDQVAKIEKNIPNSTVQPTNLEVQNINSQQIAVSNKYSICTQQGPTLDELNRACPLGYNTALGECNAATGQSVSTNTQCALGFNPWKNTCNQAHNPGRNPSDGSDKTPRVMFWCGKVNQYWNLDTQRFETDPDGFTSGEMLDPLSYCKKMYPQLQITKAEPYKRELSQNWAQAGNTNNWTSILMSYACK